MSALTDQDYRDLAEFRYQIRRFLRVTEEESRKAGIEPQQYLLLIAVRGMPQGLPPTLTNIAERLQLKHNSVVELVDRCVHRGLAVRTAEQDDRRTIAISLTVEGEEILERLAATFHNQLRQLAPELVATLQSLVMENMPRDNGQVIRK